MRVLVVDDISTNRQLLRIVLAAGGHDVVEASDGAEALRTLRSGGFDAVVTDVLMPGMDGYRLCSEIRRSEGLRDIVVIIYTATYTSPADEKVASSVGADKFLTRPAPAQAILAALEEAKTVDRPRRTAGTSLGELEVLKEYSEALVLKLENKNEELESSERRYRELVSLAPIGIYRTTLEGRFTSVNAAFARLLGYDGVEDVLRLVLARDVYADPADRARFIAEVETLGGQSSFEVRFKRRDGSVVWVRIHARAIRTEAGAIEGFEGFVFDIDERKRAEQALRGSEERFSVAFHASPTPTSISEIETDRIIDVNDGFLGVTGYSTAEVIGKTSLALQLWARPEDRERIRQRLVAEGAARDEGIQIRTRLGDIRDVMGSAVRIDLGGVPCILSTFVDVTDRQRAEKDLRKSDERFRRLSESNTIGIVVADLNGETIEANDFYFRMLGYTRDELISRRLRWDDLTPPEHLERGRVAIERLQRTGLAPPWEMDLLRKDGARVPVLIGVALLGESEGRCLAYIVDLSSRRNLEAQLRQAQKMEAVGQLAGGIAHDFNNLLTVILGFTELAAAEAEKGGPLEESIEEIRRAGERAATLTRQLLAFSRRQVLELKVLDINAVVTDLEKMLRRLIGEDVQLVTLLDPAAGRIRADAGQIEQVILNLSINARDAMPSGGTLTIETKNVELDASYSRAHVAVQAGSYVMLAVSDTGTGMSVETKSHLFEPFFTTKGLGKGTGLGLATVYGIVTQSEGNIWVYSEPGRGSTFKVYLPLVPAAAGDATPRRPEAHPTHGSETVLLVEDEKAVRTLTRKILERFGYSVLEVGDGDAALEIARHHADPIDLLLTDVVMPEVSGPDLAARIVAVRPDVKVLFMSGYTDDAIVRHGILADGVHFLQKPFTPDALARKVRGALDAGSVN